MSKVFSVTLLLLLTSIVFLTQSISQAKENYSYNVVEPKNYAMSPPTGGSERILFIVDLSNSMNEYLGNKTKMNVALDVLDNLLPKIPTSKWIGLRVYGHKTGFTQYQGCTASDLLVPIAPNNASIINKTLNGLNPRGYTPITYSLKQAVNYDFAGFTGKKRIILLTDGGENCDESPCSYAIQLIKTRPDIKIDVVALAVNDEDANSQLRCTALTTSGKYYNPKTSAQLFENMKNMLEIEKDVQGQIILH